MNNRGAGFNTLEEENAQARHCASGGGKLSKKEIIREARADP